MAGAGRSGSSSDHPDGPGCWPRVAVNASTRGGQVPGGEPRAVRRDRNRRTRPTAGPDQTRTTGPGPAGRTRPTAGPDQTRTTGPGPAGRTRPTAGPDQTRTTGPGPAGRTRPTAGPDQTRTGGPDRAPDQTNGRTGPDPLDRSSGHDARPKLAPRSKASELCGQTKPWQCGTTVGRGGQPSTDRFGSVSLPALRLSYRAAMARSRHRVLQILAGALAHSSCCLSRPRNQRGRRRHVSRLALRITRNCSPFRSWRSGCRG